MAVASQSPHWIRLHSHFLDSGTFCLVIQLIGSHQRKRAQRVEKNHIGDMPIAIVIITSNLEGT